MKFDPYKIARSADGSRPVTEILDSLQGAFAEVIRRFNPSKSSSDMVLRGQASCLLPYQPGPVASWQKDAADVAAATATGELAFSRIVVDMTLAGVRIVPSANLTADNSNYATIIVRRRNGGGTTTIAQVTTQVSGSGNWLAFQSVNVPISSSALSANDSLTVEITKTGTGVVVPISSLDLYAATGGFGMAFAEEPFFVAPYSMELKSVVACFASAIPVHATDRRTLRVYRRRGGSFTREKIAERQAGSTNNIIVAHEPFTISLVRSSITLAASDVLTFEATADSSSAPALGAGGFTLDYDGAREPQTDA